jgi:hypothetical protein
MRNLSLAAEPVSAAFVYDLAVTAYTAACRLSVS